MELIVTDTNGSIWENAAKRCFKNCGDPLLKRFMHDLGRTLAKDGPLPKTTLGLCEWLVRKILPDLADDAVYEILASRSKSRKANTSTLAEADDAAEHVMDQGEYFKDVNKMKKDIESKKADKAALKDYIKAKKDTVGHSSSSQPPGPPEDAPPAKNAVDHDVGDANKTSSSHCRSNGYSRTAAPEDIKALTPQWVKGCYIHPVKYVNAWIAKYPATEGKKSTTVRYDEAFTEQEAWKACARWTWQCHFKAVGEKCPDGIWKLIAAGASAP